jgi:hypothetical protein
MCCGRGGAADTRPGARRCHCTRRGHSFAGQVGRTRPALNQDHPSIIPAPKPLTRSYTEVRLEYQAVYLAAAERLLAAAVLVVTFRWAHRAAWVPGGLRRSRALVLPAFRATGCGSLSANFSTEPLPNHRSLLPVFDALRAWLDSRARFRIRVTYESDSLSATATATVAGRVGLAYLWVQPLPPLSQAVQYQVCQAFREVGFDGVVAEQSTGLERGAE